MGYFDAVKEHKREARATTPAQSVVRLATRAGLTPYAAAAVASELQRLDNLPRPWQPGLSYWDSTTFEVACNLIELANSPWSGYGHGDAHGDLFSHAPRDNTWGDRQITKCWESALERVGGSGRAEPTETGAPPAVTVLDEKEIPSLSPSEEDAFWDARPIIRHLHDFARARRVSPWAVLGVALARVVTATPHQVKLPAIVGGTGSLNLFVGLVGTSGSGKGAAEAVAAEALQMRYIVSHNVGSGEGIAHGYMHRAKGDLVWNDEDHAVLFSVPEIDSLAAQGDRKGATLMPQLRSGWTGESLGFGYADPTKRIIVPAHEYRLCLVAGIQPGRAGCLLNDSDGGTPQRFIWLPATDPQAPDVAPREPAPWPWSAPMTRHLAGIGGIKVEVCELARGIIDDARLARLRGEGHALDGHTLLAQLKIAAALGVADGRYSVTDKDWALAEVIMRKSDNVRAGVQRVLSAQITEANAARGEAEAGRAVLVVEKVADAAVKRACGVVVRKLRRQADWTSAGALRRCLAGRDREHFETAVERLLEAAQIEVEETSRGVSYRVRVEAD